MRLWTSNLKAAWTPSTPVCLIVPKDLGYETKSYWSTQYGMAVPRPSPKTGRQCSAILLQWASLGSHVAGAFPFGTYRNPLDPKVALRHVSSSTTVCAPSHRRILRSCLRALWSFSE